MNIMDDHLFLTLTVRILSGNTLEGDLNELRKFFEADELYRIRFEHLKAYWENKNNIETNTENALRKVLTIINKEENSSEEAAPVFQLKKKKAIVRYLTNFSKVAAVLLVCIVAAYFIIHRSRPSQLAKTKPDSSEWQLQQTSRGDRSSIVLADGTKVTMNSDSKLRYPETFRGNTREVYLTGEAFFDVVHNASKPFIIHTSKMKIKVLGTEFNVKSYPEDSTSETTLIRGLIEVTLNDRPSDKIILRPKEKLIVSNESSSKNISTIAAAPSEKDARLLISNLHYISPTDSAVVETSWMENKLVFQDESFGNLARDMERKYGVNIQFLNDSVKSFRFTGVFEKESINEALKALQLSERFNYKKAENKITIY